MRRRTAVTLPHWLLAALLAAGGAAQLGCGEREIESGETEVEVERDGDVEVERESELESDLEAAGAEAGREARELGDKADRAGARLQEGLERGAENVQRSVEEAARELEPAVREVLDDATVTARVKARLAADPDVNAFHIDVDTVDGRVTLNGKVATAHQREEAEDLARHTQGVREVVNLIRVAGASG
ncbi:MAG TPA: BON domain-containing protein [Thermoanaerobaculia bacterium]|nr:BON domain-containing protein [Thermoanaerobaculia bacterium]